MAARRIQNAFRAKQAAAKAEANARAKANAEAKAKANAEAKAKANAEAKAAANKAAKLATLLNSYKNLTNDEKVRFTRNAQTKNLESIKKSVIELLRKKAANRKEQANKAAKNKANANRRRAFNKLLQEFPTATNNDKTEARARFNPSSRDQKPANISAIRAFLNIRTRTRKEAEEKKKQANKAEAEKRAEKKRKFLEGKKPIYTNTGSPGPRIKMQTNPVATNRKNPLFEKDTNENKKAAEKEAKAKLLLIAKGLQSMINRDIKNKAQFPKYKRLTEGIQGLQGSKKLQPLTQKEFENISANYERDKSARKIQEQVRARKTRLIAVRMKENIKPLKTALENEKLMMSREKKAATEKILLNALKNQNRSKLNQVKKIINNQRATVASLQTKKQAMLQNIKKLNKPAQNSFAGRISKADSAGLNVIRKEINQALQNKRGQNRRNLLPKAKSSNNIKRVLNINTKFRSEQFELAERVKKLIGQQDMKIGKVRSYLGSEWRRKINAARTREDLRMIEVRLYVREDMVKEINKLPDKIKESKKQKIKELRSYIVPYAQNIGLFKDKLAEIKGDISKMR